MYKYFIPFITKQYSVVWLHHIWFIKYFQFQNVTTSSAQMNVSVEVSERIKAQSQGVRGQIEERVVLGEKLSEGLQNA